MIELKNVSKFYYNKGIIASGFSKVNLKLNVGEFVVITGESGSGKSTLLNVISGLDSYEEGEMYIDGEETSHFTSTDFQEYRKKYIGNIFQSFNLVNSYSVYQNVELILLINGTPKEEIRGRVEGIIHRVGLSEYTKTKVSKLSGGQKQRVSIARALAKETSIIVADEPTGNLDSQSAAGVVQLLKEIAMEKLVIVVTHNYEQFSESATRLIRMYDGNIAEDKVLKKGMENIPLKQAADKGTSLGSKVKLGIRNTFNIIPKLALLLLVFVFVILSVSGQYTGFVKSDKEMDKIGNNHIFTNYSPDRIILRRADKEVFNQADYEKISKVKNIKSIVKEDAIIDTTFVVSDGTTHIQGKPGNISDLKGKLDVGKMPTSADQIVVMGEKNDNVISTAKVSALNKKLDINVGDGWNGKVEISGIKYGKVPVLGEVVMLMSGELIQDITTATYAQKSKVELGMDGKVHGYIVGSNQNKIVKNDKVPQGKAIVSADMQESVFSGKNPIGQNIEINVSNIYFKSQSTVKIDKMYRKLTMKQLTGIDAYEEKNGEIYINPADYDSLFKRGNYQTSVYVTDIDDIAQVVKDLKQAGYEPLALKETSSNMFSDSAKAIIDIVRVPVTLFLVTALFFIAYFVIRLILKSRGTYFAILRMLGMSKSNVKKVMDIELFAVFNIAYLLFIAANVAVWQGIIKFNYLKGMIDILELKDYVVLYVILAGMAMLISRRFSKSLFKRSSMEVYRMEG